MAFKKIGFKLGIIKSASLDILEKEKETKVAGSDFQNLVENIKPLMLKLKEGAELSADEKNRIVQFYVEVSHQSTKQAFKSEIDSLINVKANATNILEPKDTTNFCYFVARAIDADEPNGNGDYFPLIEIEASYHTFIGKGLYLNHDSDAAEKAVGKIIDAYMVHDLINKKAWVECICKVDRIAHPDIARQVEVGILDSVSMGCTCNEAVCSVCDKQMFTKEDFCDHMKTGLLKKFTKMNAEITCYSINRGLTFNELSIVNIPADPLAKIHKIIAEQKLVADSVKIESALEKMTELEIKALDTMLDLLMSKKSSTKEYEVHLKLTTDESKLNPEMLPVSDVDVIEEDLMNLIDNTGKYSIIIGTIHVKEL